MITLTKYTMMAFDYIGRSTVISVWAEDYLSAKDQILTMGYYQSCLARIGDK